MAEIERLTKLRSPFRSAGTFWIEEIIDPRETRPLICDFANLAAPLRRPALQPPDEAVAFDSAPSARQRRRGVARLLATLFATQVCGSTDLDRHGGGWHHGRRHHRHPVGRRPGRRRLARRGAGGVAALALHGPLRAPPGSGHRLRPGGGRRRAGDGRCPHGKLRAAARRHDAVRDLQHVEPPGPLRGRRRHPGRAPRARHGAHRVGLDARLDRGPELDDAGRPARRGARALPGGQRLPHQHRRLRAGGRAGAAAAAARSAGDRVALRGGRDGGTAGPAAAPAARDPGRAARAHRGRHADVGSARDDRHHLHVAGLSARSGTFGRHHRPRRGHASRRPCTWPRRCLAG